MYSPCKLRVLVGTQHAEEGGVGYGVGFVGESHLVLFLVATPLDGLVSLVEGLIGGGYGFVGTAPVRSVGWSVAIVGVCLGLWPLFGGIWGLRVCCFGVWWVDPSWGPWWLPCHGGG